MDTYKVRFSGGFLDGHVEEVPRSSRWDEISYAGVANPQGKIISVYIRHSIGLREVSESTAVTDYVDFAEVPDAALPPGQTCRILKLSL